MARPIFCLTCKTMHDPQRPCSIRGLKVAGGGKKNPGVMQGRGAAASASTPATVRSTKRADEVAAPKAHTAQSARPPRANKRAKEIEVLKARLVAYLPDNERKQLLNLIDELEAKREQNRARVKAHRDKKKKEGVA